MICQGQITSNDITYTCQNLTKSNFCDECVGELCQCGQVNHFGHICQNFRCLNFKDQFRCNNNTSNIIKVCAFCKHCNNQEGELKYFGKNNFRAFNLYLRAFTWEQKFLNSIFYKLANTQRLNLLFYDKFYINLDNCSKLSSENKLVERYFLMKQIVITDLIFYLMFPNLVYCSPENIWDHYFSDQIFGDDCSKCINQTNKLINAINEDVDDVNLRVKFWSHMANEGYKTLGEDLKYRNVLIKEIKNQPLNLKNITEVRTKNFVYALTGIDL